MFKRLIKALSGKDSAAAEATAAPSAPVPATAQENLITAYDVHGREILITREQWRDNMLTPQLQAQWDDPDALYGLIINALNDDFIAEVEPASARLLAIDPMIERGHVIRAIVLMKLDALDEAEQVLRKAAEAVGETGTILTNLAKVHDMRGDDAAVDATLWQALTLDPNEDNGLGWWLARVREREGDAGHLAALQRAAALPGSWRATLHLGQYWLAHDAPEVALGLFRDALARSGYHTDALLAVSGELGNAGRIADIIDLIAPHYVAEQHGPHVGLNVAQACLHEGRLQEGEAVLSALYALDLPPFKQHLDAMAAQYQQAQRDSEPARPVDADALEIAQVPFALPIWMYGLRDPQWLFAPKPQATRRVSFLMLGKVATGAQQAEAQREDDLGRLSRAIPLYLAESVYEWTAAQSEALVTVAVGGGPVLFGAQDAAGERETAAQLAERTDVLVQGTIAGSGDGWEITLALWETATLAVIGRETVSAGAGDLEPALLALEQRVLQHLGGSQPRPHDPLYTRPDVEQLPPYLNALAQSLMLALVANGMVPKDTMWGERNMLEWPLRMALHWPAHEVAKAMYFSGISHAARYRSDVLHEFEDRTFSLLQDLDQGGSPVAGLAPLALHAFDRTDGLAAVRRQTGDAGRLAWLERVTAPR